MMVSPSYILLKKNKNYGKSTPIRGFGKGCEAFLTKHCPQTMDHGPSNKTPLPTTKKKLNWPVGIPEPNPLVRCGSFWKLWFALLDMQK